MPIPPRYITELEFGYAMLVHQSKGRNPLAAVAPIFASDRSGPFYIPFIRDYASNEALITGNKQGYASMEQTLRCVGRCFDKALADSQQRNHKE